MSIERLLLTLFFLGFFPGELAVAQNTTIPFKMGVVLNSDKWVGKMALSCIFMAVSDFYATHSFYRTRLVLHTRDPNNDIVGAASVTLDLLKNTQVQAIIGPETSSQANFVVDLGNKTQVPIVSFSATSPSLSSIKTPYFVRACLNDSTQAKAIAAIVQAFGWREAVPVYEDSDFGNGIIPYLTDALQEIDTRVPYRSVIPPLASDDQILQELYKLQTMQTRVFIVHMSASLGSRLFLKAKEAQMMTAGYVWIITDGLTNLLTSMDPSIINSMQGVLGVKPYVPKSKELESFKIRWRRKFQQDNPNTQRADLDIYGLLAYDSVWALAMAAENVGGANLSYQQVQSTDNSTDLSTLGISKIGPKLLQTILKTGFRGLSGEFRLVDGQLQSSSFQIVNVIGTGWREVGVWTPTNGILKNMSATSSQVYSTSKNNLQTVIWPGDPTFVPKGWVIPTSGKKLRIGVPVKDGFSQFVNVSHNTDTNETIVTGYCIDVFKAVMEELPYAVPYEFIPFQKANGASAGNYNDLIYQVFLQNYDAVVGDTTIIANRSLYVDFTLPYTESGVSMIVPIKKDDRKNAWIFLKPLNRDLWITSAAFFILTGFVVWLLEHRINSEFRGPVSHQIGMIFWFSFSTLVFAHRERVASNLARFVVIIWVFVVLILSSSYTASLTSMLTVQKLQPTITDIKELQNKGECVGYQEGSFVVGLLKMMNFDESKLKEYKSVDECNEGLSKGSRNGGFAAAFDEIPYIKLFLASYCSKYTVVGPTYKTDGFGFVFPRGSPLVPDISRAILNVTVGDTMRRIEVAWFGQQANCPDPNTLVSSDDINSLTMDSFWGLFLIAGVSSTLALLVFAISFYCDNKHQLENVDPDTSVWKKMAILAKQFDRKDLSSHTFRRSDDNSSHALRRAEDDDQFEDLMITNNTAPQSPTSNRTDGIFIPPEEHGRPSIEVANHSHDEPVSQEMVSSIELSNQNIERSSAHGMSTEY
uniref:Glutamate receptor n=1 Tax=Nelumbo nucifera TaxID=4432 RepID=A0A822ZQ37_NELNU|nr:TPA_asm: hypothetical protein HUJ06_003861 [Nelumbo nucifera]